MTSPAALQSQVSLYCPPVADSLPLDVDADSQASDNLGSFCADIDVEVARSQYSAFRGIIPKPYAKATTMALVVHDETKSQYDNTG